MQIEILAVARQAKCLGAGCEFPNPGVAPARREQAELPSQQPRFDGLGVRRKCQAEAWNSLIHLAARQGGPGLAEPRGS